MARIRGRKEKKENKEINNRNKIIKNKGKYDS